MILTLNLGRGYIVWDKSAHIDFLKPARGTIVGVFEIDASLLANMHLEVDSVGKGTFEFETELVDATGQAVVRVRKTVYVRRKFATS